MNFHIFVLVTSVIFYIILRMYKSRIETEVASPSKKSSNLMYILYIPVVMYLAKLMYGFTNTTTTEFPQFQFPTKAKTIGSNVSDKILSAPYPESSINVSTEYSGVWQK